MTTDLRGQRTPTTNQRLGQRLNGLRLTLEATGRQGEAFALRNIIIDLGEERRRLWAIREGLRVRYWPASHIRDEALAELDTLWAAIDAAFDAIDDLDR